MTGLEIAGLSKRFGHRTALQPLDLVVNEGIVFGYLGPNGAGKTTTIRLVMGLLKPTTGRVACLGTNTWLQREKAHRSIGYLPGDFAGYPRMTGEDYLRYLAALRDVRDPGQYRRLSERLDLDLSRPMGSLSHGNRQKVGIVQAMMHEPRVLVLDEPTSGLDPLVQRTFIELIRERKDDGCTVFLSSHIMSEVEAIADRVGILREGRLVADRDVSDIRSDATRRLDLRFVDDPPDAAVLKRVAGVRSVDIDGSLAHVIIAGSLAELCRVAAPYGVQNIVTHEADLEELFLSYYEEGR